MRDTVPIISFTFSWVSISTTNNNNNNNYFIKINTNNHNHNDVSNVNLINRFFVSASHEQQHHFGGFAFPPPHHQEDEEQILQLHQASSSSSSSSDLFPLIHIIHSDVSSPLVFDDVMSENGDFLALPSEIESVPASPIPDNSNTCYNNNNDNTPLSHHQVGVFSPVSHQGRVLSPIFDLHQVSPPPSSHGGSNNPLTDWHTEEWLSHPRMFSLLAEKAHDALLPLSTGNLDLRLSPSQQSIIRQPFSVNSIGFSCHLRREENHHQEQQSLPQQAKQQQQRQRRNNSKRAGAGGGGGEGLLDLHAMERDFRANGNNLYAVDVAVLCIEEVTPVSSNNFVVIKGSVLNCPVSIKVYAHGYIQLFGLKDTPEAPATRLAHAIFHLTLDKINSLHPSSRWAIRDIVALSLSARHDGVSAFERGFNLPVLKTVFDTAASTFPDGCVSTSTHSRNGALIVNFKSSKKAKLGSMMFHGTGTSQLMGVSGVAPNVAAEQLLDLCLCFPQVIMKQTHKRRIRIQPSAARLRRNRDNTTTATEENEDENDDEEDDDDCGRSRATASSASAAAGRFARNNKKQKSVKKPSSTPTKKQRVVITCKNNNPTTTTTPLPLYQGDQALAEAFWSGVNDPMISELAHQLEN